MLLSRLCYYWERQAGEAEDARGVIMTRDEQPRSTVEQLIRRFLPRSCQRFLLGQSEELRHAYVILRALFGALSGAAMFAAIAPGLPLTFDHKLATGCAFTGACALGGATSSVFRCAVLLMFPTMLGARGRAFLMLLLLSTLYSGPVSNIQHNMEKATASLTCNLELQVRNTKLLWRDAITPFHKVAEEVTQNEAELKAKASSAREAFAAVRQEVLAGGGTAADGRSADRTGTQKLFAFSTLTKCEGMVKAGIRECADWFSNKWKKCDQVVQVPVIKNILCVPMKFSFLCDIMKVMTGWCKQHIPVEKNFGQLFDHLNASMDLLSTEFTSRVVYKEHRQRTALHGELADGDLMRSIHKSFRQLAARTRRLLDVLRLLASLAFLSVFAQSLAYVLRFQGDVFFDNVYLTKYLGIIDRRRKSLGKQHLLPLTPSERRNFVDPWSPRIHPEEVKQVLASVVQVLSVLLLAAVLLMVDASIFRVLDVVSKHTHTTFNVSSTQQVDIQVSGNSILARLLRKSFAAFNTSSSVHVVSNNQRCVTPPSSLAISAYVSIACCLLLAALSSCLQVYTNRLRRVIAAFYHPQREKTRILFLYNCTLYRRILHRPSCIQHTRTNMLECLSRLCRRRRERQEASKTELQSV
ncbi:E3 ubiquitin-protein ligase DCST1 isoform 2-T2 [Syngnathus typhle]